MTRKHKFLKPRRLVLRLIAFLYTIRELEPTMGNLHAVYQHYDITVDTGCLSLWGECEMSLNALTGNPSSPDISNFRALRRTPQAIYFLAKKTDAVCKSISSTCHFDTRKCVMVSITDTFEPLNVSSSLQSPGIWRSIMYNWENYSIEPTGIPSARVKIVFIRLFKFKVKVSGSGDVAFRGFCKTSISSNKTHLTNPICLRKTDRFNVNADKLLSNLSEKEIFEVWSCKVSKLTMSNETTFRRDGPTRYGEMFHKLCLGFSLDGNRNRLYWVVDEMRRWIFSKADSSWVNQFSRLNQLCQNHSLVLSMSVVLFTLFVRFTYFHPDTNVNDSCDENSLCLHLLLANFRKINDTVKSFSLLKRKSTSKNLLRIIAICELLSTITRTGSSCVIGNNFSGLPCLEYNSNHSTFTMTCSFDWPSDPKCIRLQKNERFEGNGHALNMSGHSNWKGLFQIADSGDGSPTSFEDAPIIRNVHMIGGKTSTRGGFLIQAQQKHFIVESCSSSGVIQGKSGSGGGGICGERCSGDILISHCMSTGEIKGWSSGGIAGRELVRDGGRVNITRCYSTGDILGELSGGICGLGVGWNNSRGQIFVTQSYSTGKIAGTGSGGICGARTGYGSGVVRIDQCYSVGEISEDKSGGITGQTTARQHGIVSITKCYSRGAITGEPNAGGICGRNAGWEGGTVIMTNVYSSGDVINETSGSLIGHIRRDSKIKIIMSVYSDPMIGENDASNESSITTKNNSNSLANLNGTIYCYENHCWDISATWQIVANNYPILAKPPSPAPIPTPTGTLTPLPKSHGSPSATPTPTKTRMNTSDENTDVGRIVQPEWECLSYDVQSAMFGLMCSFEWKDGYFPIVLLKNQTFEGNGHTVNITGLTDWSGLFGVAHSSNGGPSSLEDAPEIRNVHIVGGETSGKGGFIVQAEQNHFIVKGCSSSGVIRSLQNTSYFAGGGICGQRCSGDILITHCRSSGEIQGARAGGIAGRELGIHGNGNTININHCYSTGDINGQFAGGICGAGAGEGSNAYGGKEGGLFITHSYSTGKISGESSGGICGPNAARNNGTVTIEQCFSEGAICGSRSGGITGTRTAWGGGIVSILNCYSRGDMTGSTAAGGICGRVTGGCGGTVILTNVYASGSIKDKDAGGLIGSIENDAKEIRITMSVFHGATGSIVGGNVAADTNRKNSGNLTDIISTVYCCGKSHDECWDTETTWQAVDCDFPVFLMIPPPLPTAIPSETPLGFSSKAQTPTMTRATSANLYRSGSPSGSTSSTLTTFMSSFETPTLRISPSITACCPHRGESTLSTTWERTDVLVLLCVTGSFCLLITYIAYRRLRNKRRARSVKSDYSRAEIYAIQLGVKFDNHSEGSQSGQQTVRSGDFQKESPVDLVSGATTSENPVSRIKQIREGSSSHTGSTATYEGISAANGFETSGNLKFVFVDMNGPEAPNLSMVKALSAKQPNLKSIDNIGSSSTTEQKIQIARISEIDTSAMSTLDRTIMKLRQWKAKLLAEPPPVVKVSVEEDFHDSSLSRKSDKAHQSKIVSQLEFAASRIPTERAVTNNEISRYTQSRRGGDRLKKEFIAIPPSFLQKHEGKT